VSRKARFPIGNSLWIDVPLTLAPGEVKTVRLSLSWHGPYSDVRAGNIKEGNLDPKTDFYRPWYAEKFKSIEEVVTYWNENETLVKQGWLVRVRGSGTYVTHWESVSSVPGFTTPLTFGPGRRPILRESWTSA
jgi:hypothetical protein